MGASVSKVKKLRKRRKAERDLNPYALEHRNSGLYEEIECNGTVNVSQNPNGPPTHGTEQQNDGPDRNIARSSTCSSRDSALGDDSLNSRLSSIASLAHHAVTEQSDCGDYGDNTSLCRYLQHSTRHVRTLCLDIPTSEDWVDYTCQSTSRRASIVMMTDDLDAECSRKKEMPTEAIPYMIDVFMPLLQGSIRVLEIIPHLHFIDDTDSFRNKDRENPREAVMMLIERIKASQEPGKWQTFLEALSSGGYTHIYDLLKGHTENDLTIHRKLLRLFTPHLVNRIEPREFLDHLYEKHVISEGDMEEIRCEERNRGPIAASLMLLESLPRKNPDWYQIFVDVLKTCGLEDIVDDFDIPGNPDTCCTGSQHHSAPCSMAPSSRDPNFVCRHSVSEANRYKPPQRPSSRGSKSQAASIQAVQLPLRLIPSIQPARPAVDTRPTPPQRQTSETPDMSHERQTGELKGHVNSSALDRSYITPTNDYLPMLPNKQHRTSGKTLGLTHMGVISGNCALKSDRLDEGEEDDGHQYMTLDVNGSTEIARLRDIKEKLKREVEETKVKNKLKREIRQLNKELMALRNADLSEEGDSEDNTELPTKHSDAAIAPEIARPELQMDIPVMMNIETQTIETFNTNSNILHELEALKLNMLVLNERMTTSLQNTRANGVTDIYFPMDHIMSSPLPIYSSKLREKNAPLPHLNSMEDSGVFSDSSLAYLSI